MLSRTDKAGLAFVAIVFVLGVILLGALFAREAGAQEINYCEQFLAGEGNGTSVAGDIGSPPALWSPDGVNYYPCTVAPPEVEPADVPEGSAWRAWAGQTEACVVMYDTDPDGGIDSLVPWLSEFTLWVVGDGWEVDAGYLPTSGAYIGQTPCVQPTPDEDDEQAESWTLHLYVEPEAPMVPGGDC